MMKTKENAWNVPVAVDDIPETGLHVEIEAPAEVRADIAEVAGLRELPRLSATFELLKQGSRVTVTGQVSATVGQTCVVTLEPIESRIEEPVDLVFAPLPAGAIAEAGDTRSRKGSEEPPEPLLDGHIDLGVIATEFLILGIDPYPRKAGAHFMPPEASDEGAHPFAALEALKKRPGSQKT